MGNKGSGKPQRNPITLTLQSEPQINGIIQKSVKLHFEVNLSLHFHNYEVLPTSYS